MSAAGQRQVRTWVLVFGAFLVLIGSLIIVPNLTGLALLAFRPEDFTLGLNPKIFSIQFAVVVFGAGLVWGGAYMIRDWLKHRRTL